MSVRRGYRTDTKTGEQVGFWLVDVKTRDPEGKKHRVRRVSMKWNRRDGLAVECRIRQAIQEGRYGKSKETDEKPKKPPPAVQEFHKEFIEIYARTNNKPSTVEGKQSVFKHHIVPFFGRMRLDEIGAGQIERFKALLLRKGLKAKTINNHLSVLRTMLTVATDWELIEHVPRIKWLKAPRPGFDFLEFEEAEQLIAGADEDWSAAIVVALRTGLRLGELRALRWEDVDLKRGVLTVAQAAWKDIVGTPKNGMTRQIPLCDDALTALKQHRHLRGEYVFCREDGSLLGKGGLDAPLRRARKRAGLRHLSWHVLRHTFASHLVMRGVPLKVVQELMGHSTIEMTMRYAHLSAGSKRDAVNKLVGRSR